MKTYNEASQTIEILYKGAPLTLSLHDVDNLLNFSLYQRWSAFYQIGLLDVRDTCVRTVFQGRRLSITLKEFEELRQELLAFFLKTD
jgi:hypothetical protein